MARSGRKRKSGSVRDSGGVSRGLIDLTRPVISVHDIERRLLRACMTLRALPDPERRFQAVRSAWPEMQKEPGEAYGYNDATIPRFRPSPADVSDFLVALSWVRGMNWNDFRLIWWRSYDVSFKQISWRIGRSDETARVRFRDAILQAWHAANTAHQAAFARSA
jgi:hypothetical protein